MYLNGTDAYSSENSTPTGTRESEGDQDLSIGNNGSRTRTWDGYIEQIILHDTARSAAWAKFAHANAFEADNELSWDTKESASSSIELTIPANNITLSHPGTTVTATSWTGQHSSRNGGLEMNQNMFMGMN